MNSKQFHLWMILQDRSWWVIVRRLALPGKNDKRPLWKPAPAILHGRMQSFRWDRPDPGVILAGSFSDARNSCGRPAAAPPTSCRCRSVRWWRRRGDWIDPGAPSGSPRPSGGRSSCGSTPHDRHPPAGALGRRAAWAPAAAQVATAEPIALLTVQENSVHSFNNKKKKKKKSWSGSLRDFWYFSDRWVLGRWRCGPIGGPSTVVWQRDSIVPVPDPVGHLSKSKKDFIARIDLLRIHFRFEILSR